MSSQILTRSYKLYAFADAKDAIQGAETTLYALLSDEMRGISGVYLEDCCIKQPSKNAQNIEDQERLWEVTNGLLTPWAKTTDLYETKKSV